MIGSDSPKEIGIIPVMRINIEMKITNNTISNLDNESVVFFSPDLIFVSIAA